MSGCENAGAFDQKEAKRPGALVDIEKIFAIEARRKAAKLSIGRLCAAAGVDQRTYERLIAGRTRKVRRDTLAKLERSVGGLALKAPSPEGDHILLLAAFCAWLSGADASRVLAQDLTVQRPQNRDWLEAAKFRRWAVWIAAVELGLPRATIAKAIGATRQAIKQTIDAVEEARDTQPELVEFLDRAARLATGAAHG